MTLTKSEYLKYNYPLCKIQFDLRYLWTKNMDEHEVSKKE